MAGDAEYVRRTWADGFGTWHAACSPSADLAVLRTQAERAIFAEISERDAHFDPASTRVVYDGSGNGEMFFIEREVK